MMIKIGSNNSFLMSLVLLAGLFWPGLLLGQGEGHASDCERILVQAKLEYEKGNLDEVRRMVEPCLENGQLSKDVQEQLNLLLTGIELYRLADSAAAGSIAAPSRIRSPACEGLVAKAERKAL